MNELLIMEKLVEIARKESTPSVDVTMSVMQNLMMIEEPVISLWWFAVSTLSIIISFVLFWQICHVSPDPLIMFFESIRSALL